MTQRSKIISRAQPVDRGGTSVWTVLWATRCYSILRRRSRICNDRHTPQKQKWPVSQEKGGMIFFSTFPQLPLGRTTGGGTFFFLRSVRGSACRMCVCVCSLHCTTHCIAANWRWLHCFVYPRRRSQKKKSCGAMFVCPSLSSGPPKPKPSCDATYFYSSTKPPRSTKSNRIGKNTTNRAHYMAQPVGKH